MGQSCRTRVAARSRPLPLRPGRLNRPLPVFSSFPLVCRPVNAMHLLEQAAVFLLTAVLLVPVFQRLKLGAVLGYLGAGMLIGPWGLGMIGEVESTLQFAEFGVVLLLFLVGLELQPSRLWVLRRPVFGLGGAQVLATGAVLAGLALAFGFSWEAALVAGFGLAMSSTALVLASLAERKQLATRHGREAFAVLLFQDRSVIPLLALLPLLSDSGTHAAGGWMAAAKGLAVIAGGIVSGRLVLRPGVGDGGGYGGRGGVAPPPPPPLVGGRPPHVWKQLISC